MTLIGEFRISAEMFALQETLRAVPEAVIEIERVVASDDLLTPFLWVANCDLDSFESAVDSDGSVQNIHRLDTAEDVALYRADWTERTEAVAFAYTSLDAVIVEATGQHTNWELRIRFEGNDQLREFREHCDANDIEFTLQRLYGEDADRRGARFGLTEKQIDALTTAWEFGYFETPRRVDLREVADELGVSKQSVAQRLRRAHQTWIGSTLEVTEPE